MGFPFATPTSCDEPVLRFGSIDYYAVDHTPSYLWDSASRSIFGALIVHLPTVLAGRAARQLDETIRRAVAIDQGVVIHPTILSLQGRATAYPHAFLAA